MVYDPAVERDEYSGSGGGLHSLSAQGCGCMQCAGLGSEDAGDGLGGLSGAKPVQSLDWIITNFSRSNSRWPQGSTIQYSFREALPPGADASINFEAFSGIERQFTRMGFDLISDVANLTFIEVPDDGREVKFSDRIYFGKDTMRDADDAGVWGYAQRWGFGSRTSAGEIWTFSQAVAERQWIVGGYNFQALMHEQLHALGIPHPGNYNAGGEGAPPITYANNAEYAQDSRQFTIMSYFPASSTGSDFILDSQSQGLYSGATPLLHDIAVLQALYGANMNTRTGDTTYGYNSNTGRASLSIVPNSTVADTSVNSAPIFSIWDAGGIDLLDLSLTIFAANVDLNPGAFSDAFQMTNNISIAFGVMIENASTGSGNDRITGNAADNVLRAGDGNDDISGRDGNDQLFGGDGDDALGGGEGDDGGDGGGGRDVIFGEGGRDWLNGMSGDDRIFAGDGDDLMGGQDGNDVINGNGGRDTIFGDAGADWLNGDEDNDRIYGQDGDDLMGGQDGDDLIEGGAGRDMIFGDAGNDWLNGQADNDRIHGQDGDDLMGGQEGDDVIVGGAGRDTLFGDDGNDWLNGELDGDRIYGQGGDDLMGGQEGDDLLDGGAGRDTLYGDDGADTIVGGAGADILFGQGGGDTFFFGALFDSRAGEVDRIVDFNAGAGDRIDLSAIDANSSVEGDQAFGLVGAFSGRAGEAMLSFDGTFTTLTLDVNGDRLEDFRLLIDGQVDGSTGLIL